MVRVKRRYILFEIIPNNNKLDKLGISEKDIIETIKQSVTQLYGDYGLGSVIQSIQLKRYNYMTRTGLLATKRNNCRLSLTAIPFIRRVQHLDCIFRIIHLSGTIRGCLKALRNHHNKQIIKLRNQLNCCHKIKAIEMGFKDIESSLIGKQTPDESIA